MKPPKVTVCLCYNLHWLPVSSLFAASLVSASGFPIPSACSAPWDVWGWPLPLSESTMKICRPVFISSFWVVTVTLRETWPWLQSCVACGLPPYGPGAELAGQCQPLSLAWRQGPRLCSDFAELHKRGPVEASLVCQLSKVLLWLLHDTGTYLQRGGSLPQKLCSLVWPLEVTVQ